MIMFAGAPRTILDRQNGTGRTKGGGVRTREIRVGGRRKRLVRAAAG